VAFKVPRKKNDDSDDAGSGKPSNSTQAAADADDLPEYEPLTPELVEDEAVRGDFMLRWAVVLLAMLMGWTYINQTETLVHVKTGQYLASHGVIPPANDVFSYTAAERPWVNLSWLFDLIVAGIYGVGGAIGLTIFKAVLAAVTFWFVVNLGSQRTTTWGVSICGAVALLACHGSLTAQPELITLLGLAATFWILNSWKQGGPANRIWILIPLFLLWGNLDPRMFFGLVALVLYGIGDFMGVLWGRPSLTDEQRKPYQLVVLGCLVASLINPFGWNSLLRPFVLYGTEYPAYREFLKNSPINAGTAKFYSLTDAGVWSNMGHAGLAAAALGFAALAFFFMNYRRADIGQILVFFGFSAFALAAAEQLPVAALVFAMLAAINGQDWYRSNFKQTYSIKTSDLLFSRGGRAVTVLAFFALAMLTITGWLRAAGGSSTGWGWDYSLKQSLASLEKQSQETYSDRAYNFSARQGDMLIWVNQKPFIDMRLPLYIGEGDQNLLNLHLLTNDSLRIQHVEFRGPQQQEQKVKPDDWIPVFDQYDITHVVARLTSSPRPDYAALRALIFSPGEWELTSLSGAAAFFHRLDPDDQELTEFLSEHRYDFIDKAFREETKKIEPRTDWATAPSWYDQKFWKDKTASPDAVQQARHLNVVLQDLTSVSQQMPLANQGVYPAMAWMSLRSALRGLDEDPNSADGYVQLGEAYRYLAFWNQSRMLGQPQWRGRDMRSFQAVMAYNQAITADPDNALAHNRLFEFYNSPGFVRVDLALRELKELDRILRKKVERNETEEQQLTQIGQMRVQMEKHIEQLNATLLKATEAGANPLQHAQLAASRFQCPIAALEQLEGNPEFVATNPMAKQLLITLLLEVGRIQDAYEAAVTMEYEQSQSSQQMPGWRNVVIAAYLANAEYDRVSELWRAEAKDLEKANYIKLLNNLPPKVSMQARFPWPVTALSETYQFLNVNSQRHDMMELDLAFSMFESGDTEGATEVLRELLEKSPNSALRGIITFYLSQATGEFIDPVPPANRVPVLFHDETEK